MGSWPRVSVAWLRCVEKPVAGLNVHSIKDECIRQTKVLATTPIYLQAPFIAAIADRSRQAGSGDDVRKCMRCADKDGAKKAQPHGPGNHQQSDRCCLNMPGPASYVGGEMVLD
jgi:hypothetical protein